MLPEPEQQRVCAKKRKRYDALCVLVCRLHENGGCQSHICTSMSVYCFILGSIFTGTELL